MVSFNFATLAILKYGCRGYGCLDHFLEGLYRLRISIMIVIEV